jgi:VWFA-related protein
MRATLSRIVVLLAVAVATLQTASARQGAQDPPPPPPQNPQTQKPAEPQDPQRPTFRTGINFVRVDVIVTDRDGKPVLDLTPEEFAVSEDGKPQKIEQFDVVKIDSTEQAILGQNSEIRTRQDEEREAARPEVRLFVFLLDDYHVRRGNDMAVRKPLIDFIENQLAPADMVAIMYPLTPVDDILFTRNRSRLVSAINAFEGRKFNYTPRNHFEEQYAYYPAQTVEKIRNQISMDALQAAAIRMGGLREGRKSIIWVSEGLTTSLPPQLNDPVAAMKGFGNPNRGNPTATVDERTDWMRQTDMLSDLRVVFDTVNRQNTSIYAVDPRGLAAFEYGINEGVGLQQDAAGLRASLDTLHTIANNTDGRAIVNRNDLAVGMQQIIRDSSGYYLLGYSSSVAPTDGKFHEIKVNVKRRGVNVRARKGYWALTKEDVARVTTARKPEPPAAVTKALSSLAAPRGGRAARFWIGTARAENGMSRVTFAWEPDAGEGPSVSARGTAKSVQLTAVAPDGRPVYRGDVASGDAGGSVSFDVPPGQLQFKMTVEGDKGEVLDAETRELTIPDYTHVQTTLSTPAIFRARTVKDVQNIRANASAAPTVDRDFSRSERLLIRVSAYAPGGVTPTVVGKLLNRTGASMADLPMQAFGLNTFETELPLSALAAGEYLIELTATTPSGTAKDTIAFKVGR